MRNTTHLSHIAHEVYRHDRGRFYVSLFAPEAAREKLLAIYALNCELAAVHESVREEMIGHIRYAWWSETIEALQAGKARAGHPVCEALLPIAARIKFDPLIEAYRAAYPDLPPLSPPPLRGRVRVEGISNKKITPHLASPSRGEELYIDSIMEKLSLELLQFLGANETHWRKANGILTRHRQRYGNRRNNWLSLKLLIAGF